MRYHYLLSLPFTFAFQPLSPHNTLLLVSHPAPLPLKPSFTESPQTILGIYGKTRILAVDVHAIDLSSEFAETPYLGPKPKAHDVAVVLERQKHNDDEADAEDVWIQRIKGEVGNGVVVKEEKEVKHIGVVYPCSIIREHHIKGDRARVFAIISRDEADALSTKIPPNTQLLIVPSTEMKPADQVPKDHVVEKVMQSSELPHQDEINAIIERMTPASINSTVRILTGEDGSMYSRHSKSEELIAQATEYLSGRFKSYGCQVSLMPYRTGFAPNIICEITGTTSPEKVIILSAHYDDRNAWIYGPKGRAPGANDDGSGTSMVIEAAKALHEANFKPKVTVRLILFSGEEQGLFGSKAYAEQVVANRTDVLAMIQCDMLGYHKPGEDLQVGFPGRYATERFTEMIVRVFKTYIPSVRTGVTFACCSDHQSFYEKGIFSTQIFERTGEIADPMYHNKLDLSDREGYDVYQISLLGKGALAALLTLTLAA